MLNFVQNPPTIRDLDYHLGGEGDDGDDLVSLDHQQSEGGGVL